MHFFFRYSFALRNLRKNPSQWCNHDDFARSFACSLSFTNSKEIVHCFLCAFEAYEFGSKSVEYVLFVHHHFKYQDCFWQCIRVEWYGVKCDWSAERLMTGMRYYAFQACDVRLANHHRLSTFPSNYSQKMNDNDAFSFPQHHSQPYQKQWQTNTKLQQSSWLQPIYVATKWKANEKWWKRQHNIFLKNFCIHFLSSYHTTYIYLYAYIFRCSD